MVSSPAREEESSFAALERATSGTSQHVGSSAFPRPATDEEARVNGKEEHAEDKSASVTAPVDIEHMEVHDDPRKWSRTKKHLILAGIAFCAMSGALSANTFFPSVAALQQELEASDQLVAATVSLFIFGQGLFPIFWSTIAELKGRKIPYITSLIIYCVSTIVLARANSIALFVVFRVFQSLGGSALLALGAGTLADIFDTFERGRKVGIFYGLPLLSIGIGPLIGGGLTLAPGSWRNPFYFLFGYGALSLGVICVMPDTFRPQRSLSYQLAFKRQQAHNNARLAKAKAALPPGSSTPPLDAIKGKPAFGNLGRVLTALSVNEQPIKMNIHDLNPFANVGIILRQKHNVLSSGYSGLLFAAQYATSYSTSRTFLAPPYNYSSIQVGLILLSFGIGNIVGNVLGGRWSDRTLKKLKERNGGTMEPEFRIRSTFEGMMVAPLALIAFGWVVEKRTPIYWPVICLFLFGVSCMFIYSSTLAYVVDANPGRSTSAVACNSLLRGIGAAVLSQINTLIIARIGDGWYYTSFSFVLMIGQAGFAILYWKGKAWREAARDSEIRREEAANYKTEHKGDKKLALAKETTASS